MHNGHGHKSTCSYCGVGCGVEVFRDRYGRITLRGDAEHPVNRGMLCSKGLNLHQVVMDRADRLLYPQMRWSRGHPLQRVSWDEALGRAAAVFCGIIEHHGPEAVALYVSGQCLTEEYYIANKLMKGFIGANNIDTNSRLCMSSAVAGYKLALGDDAVPVSYEDIEHCDCFFIAGANPAWCHPILFRRIEQRKAQNPDVKIIVADPRRTHSCGIADLHLQLQPGTDVTLYHALARLLIERGMIDHDFICEHTEGFAALRERVMQVSVVEAAAICRIELDDLIAAAEMLGRSRAQLTLWAMGLNQSVIGVNKNLALLNLSLLTGKIGKPGCGPFSLTGQPNAMGGREVGGLANLLAAHHDLANPEHRAKVARYWGGGEISAKPGLTATEQLEALERGDLKAIWIICTNPAVSLPQLQKMERGLRNARFVIVQDISNRSDTLQFADLILPAAGWLEKQGTMTNSERRISYLSKVIDPPGEARPDVQILCDFAKRMGFGAAFDYKDESEIFTEHAQLTQGTPIDISGLSYERLKREGSIQWPAPAGDHPGTPRLFGDHRFYTGNGHARLSDVPPENQSAPTSDELPFVLTTGRVRDQWHTMTRTGKVNKLLLHARAPFVEIHPADAQRLNLASGDTVELANANGAARVRAEVTEAIKPGVLFMPMHWGRRTDGDWGRANNLTHNLVDPRSKEPDFKYSAVRLTRVARPRKKIVVVGAGAAALQFIHAYRERNHEDEIHVFGGEPQMFYNRILLIEYISGRRQWDELLTCDAATLLRLNVVFHAGVKITRIDRAGRTVTDEHGVTHHYDALLLATGSRPNIFPGTPIEQENCFSIRTRADAERIKQFVAPGRHVLVVGGGLLGLEMAAEFSHAGMQVTVLEHTPQLMGRQLDPAASAILAEYLEDRGIQVILNDSIQEYRKDGTDRTNGTNTTTEKFTPGRPHDASNGTSVNLAPGRPIDESSGAHERITRVRTRGGVRLECDLLFFATGVKPNIELGVEAGLQFNRGLIVDDQMRTSDPAIYAAGEIAEHRGMLYGTTPSANDQAAVAAAHLAGDQWAQYPGSVLFNVLKVHGLELSAIGQTQAPPDDPEYEEVVLLDRRRLYYKKCVIRRNRLVGAILIGGRAEFEDFKQLIAGGIELDERRDELLRTETAGAGGREIIGAIVCSCNSVGRGNLEQWIEAGCVELEDLCRQSRAGTGCGSCKPEVKSLLDSRLALV